MAISWTFTITQISKLQIENEKKKDIQNEQSTKLYSLRQIESRKNNDTK